MKLYKSKSAALERELAETKKQVADPQLVSSMTKRLETAEARVKELEGEIRFVNYSKHPEFQEKYQKPYEQAWTAAMADINELTVTEDDGQVRKASHQDLMRLASLPLAEARAEAVRLFGDSADDIMAHRRQIRDLSTKQQQALEQARKEGLEKDQQQTAAQRQIRESVAQLWTEHKETESQKQPFLQEREGDEEWNTRLKDKVELVDSIVRQSVMDPKLTPEQRAEAVRRHVAVRNRAIGFSMKDLELTRAKKEIADLQKKLDEYKKVEPGGGDGHPAAGAAAVPADPMAAAKARIRAKAAANP